VKPKLLIVDDDVAYCDSLSRVLTAEYAVTVAHDAASAQALFGSDFSAVLLDVRLQQSEADRHGLLLLRSFNAASPEVPVIMMTAFADIDLAVEAMKLGAVDFISKMRADVRELHKVLVKAVAQARLRQKAEVLQRDLQRMEPWELVGSHASLAKMNELVNLAALDGRCTVMIRGETGSGKELVARAIHSRGSRRDMPFIAVSIASLPAELVSAELFGIARGAYTDARQSRMGYIEQAQGGVLFLDEVGELHPAVQQMLLRFLEERTMARLGSTAMIKLDVQIVSATNRNFEDAIREGHFRQDLFYRLQGVVIEVPTLRERLSDVPELSAHFLSTFRKQGRCKHIEMSEAALKQLGRHDFPGNIRELKSVVERAMMWANARGDGVIGPDDLPAEVKNTRVLDAPPHTSASSGDEVDLDRYLAISELRVVSNALTSTDGSKQDAWKLLGLNDRFALRRRVKRIAGEYPELLQGFPNVQQLYKRKGKP
jgi:DNA-binding NtrC family response regulator